MDLGLGHLTELKAHLLNESMRAASTYDNTIAAIGRGVALRFDAACNRKLARSSAAVFECPGDVAHFSVDRYPLESVDALALRESMADGFVDLPAIDELIENISAEAGLVFLAAPLSTLCSSRLRATFTGGYWYPTAPAIALQTGRVTFAEGEEMAQVLFDESFAEVPAVKATAIVGAGETSTAPSPYAVTVDGFSLRLASPAGADGLTVEWLAVYGGDEADPAVLQSGRATLAADDETKEVVFATEFAAAPVVVCTVIAPEGGLIIDAVPITPTAEGFTAQLGFPIPATGYALSWVAVYTAAAAAAQTLPFGATALPYDLKLAWLLQCQLVWQTIDATGSGLGDAKAKAAALAALGSLTLAPEVEATLRQYRRYTL